MVLRILMVVDTDGLSMKFDFQFSMVLMVLIVVMVLIVNLICPFAGSRYTLFYNVIFLNVGKEKILK